MIKLFAYDAQTFFDGQKWELKEHLYPLLRIEDKKYFWKEKYLLRKFAYFRDVENESERNKKIEQIREQVRYTKFYDGRSKTFLTGLLPKVLRKLKKAGIRFKFFDKRKKFANEFSKINKFRFKKNVEYREEQVEVVNAALKAKRGILHCATNTGKTLIAAAIIAEIESQENA